ncbi:uncharacterized protein LOC134271590 [Saccostrea cucullata]|uniref:uncharacterized protein LOC134271590 n=1 Tax=Saccostrea cuccullata TaxID=36930 RepID=UPI002ED09DF6
MCILYQFSGSKFSSHKTSNILFKKIKMTFWSSLVGFVFVSLTGLISPCRDPNLINNSLRMMNVGVPCFYKSVKRSKTVSCRNIQRAAHCVISRLNDETNNTCDVKDKIYLAKKFLAIFPEQSRVNASICIKEFLSEFPATIDNTTDTITLLRDKEASTYSQTHVFLAIGFTLVMVFVASVIICIFGIRKTLMRKKRKELMPLPVIQNAEDPSYEIDLAYPDGLYHDPDYESIDDQEEGYERLPGEIEEMRSQNLVDNDVGGEYTAPNNADGTYLDVVHPKIYSHDYTNVNPYLELVEKTVECQTVLDTKDIPK